MRITEEYKNCLGTLRNRAYYFSKKFGLDYDDMLSTANEVFCIAFRSYDKNRNMKFNSWLVRLLNKKMFDYAVEQSMEIADTPYINLVVNTHKTFVDSIEDSIYINEQMHKMSKKAQRVLKAILYPAKHEIKMYSRQEVTKTTIRKYFVQRRKWQARSVNRCFNEIERVLQIC